MAAQLSLRPPVDDTPRQSQLLPTIKCSTCAQPIPLDGLADHICSGPPAPLVSRSSRSPPAAATIISSNNYSNPSSMASRRLAPPQIHPAAAPRSPSPLGPPSTRPSFDQSRPSFEQPQSRPSFDNSQRPQPPRSPFQEHMVNQHPPQQMFPAAPAPDTKTGGTAGMAGVGRRGFAAAAAAAMFTVAHPQPHRNFVDMKPPILNIPDPVSPPSDPRAPSPYGHNSNHGHGSNHGHNSDHGHQQPPLSLIGDSRQRRPSAAERPTVDMAHVKLPSPTRDVRRKASPDHSSPKSPPALAYLDSTVSSKDVRLSPTERKRSDAGHGGTSTRGLSNLGKTKALDGGTSRDAYAVDFPKAQHRKSAGTESLYSTSSRGHKAGASLERSLSSPFESTSSPSLSHSTHPTSAGSSGADHLKVLPQHPTRSMTSPSLSRPDKPPKDQPTTRRRSEKKCVKCGKKITDGKWVQVDSTDSESTAPSVLCEYDWKMLYLPKCRRCDKPIEGQAIGSADGQIKGKYHRDCFNCTGCQIPFPDKSFYVFDGKPFCEYHYHEANNSLCASPRCGLPIEGPCAVAHNGDRYHPAHFICESSTCKEELHDEYWEIDGTRLCDRHARLHPMFEDTGTQAGHHIGDDDDENDKVRDSLATTSSYDPGNASFGRAQKRMTRYVDL